MDKQRIERDVYIVMRGMPNERTTKDLIVMICTGYDVALEHAQRIQPDQGECVEIWLAVDADLNRVDDHTLSITSNTVRRRIWDNGCNDG